MTFGARFGLLVRRYREGDGISASDLALKAFGDTAKRSRLSEIENGKVARPHAKTIEALCEALGISTEEVEDCRRLPAPAASPLPQNTGLPPALLENLAMRFGHENPDAPTSELEAFLKQKASDFKEMQQRLAALAEAEGRVANLLASAQGALADGNFEEADARLGDAEEMQQTEHTLPQVRKQVDLRIERGRAALLNGDAALAADHYQVAAGFLAPFSSYRQAELLAGLATHLHEHGLRFGGLGLAKAIKTYRAALRVYTEVDHPVDWASTQNNLANALQEQGARTGGADGAALIGEAVETYRAALRVRTEADHPVAWATTQNNLAIALREQGARTGGAEGAALIGEAVETYRAALRVRTEADHPVAWATTQNNLANALQEQGARTGGADGAALIGEAVETYRSALRVRTEADHPVDWAMTQENIGLAFMTLSTLDPAKARHNLELAVSHFRRALTKFDPIHMPFNHEKAQNALEIAQEALEALGSR